MSSNGNGNDQAGAARRFDGAQTAPEGAPNFLVILLDDMGFGAPSAFGGPCPMPVADQLAADGLRYSRFHTTALCSPTRSALLTGRNHHSVGMGVVTNFAMDAPGYNAIRPKSKAGVAEVLRQSGYATGAFGKMHQTPGWEISPVGPFDRWPTNQGFERFYGILDGGADQFVPDLVDGTTFVDPPTSPEQGYHFSEDIVDQARAWIRTSTALRPDQPWFTYLAFCGTHAPFHVPAEWRDRYRGQFAHGWDEQRRITLERQKQLGVVPEDAELSPWAPGAPHWDELSDDGRAVAERLMEVYAAYAEHTDHQVGRLVDELRASGQLDNTVIYYILGDNGASTEGGIEGTLNEFSRYNDLPHEVGEMVARLDEIGGPETAPHYPVGWALAMDSPYQWAKQVASHYGGTRNGLIVHWPEGIDPAERGGVRHQWHHVIDVAPTLLEAAGLPHPELVNGVEQDPIEGTSMLYSVADGEAAERHTTQYFEMIGNRGIYHEGWTAVTKHRTPWRVGNLELNEFEDDVWELYDTSSDWTQARDVAAEHPEKLAELQELFTAEARKYQVLPLDDRLVERLLPGVSGRPTPPDTIVLDPALPRFGWDAVPDIKNSSFTLRAIVEVGAEPGDGTLVAEGGRFAGWSLYVEGGRPAFAYSLAGKGTTTEIEAAEPLRAGRHEIEFRFAYDGGGLGKGGTGRLFVDGEEQASGRIEKTAMFAFGYDPLSVGSDWGTPATDAYSGEPPYAYADRIESVTITAGDDAVAPSTAERLEATLKAE